MINALRPQRRVFVYPRTGSGDYRFTIQGCGAREDEPLHPRSTRRFRDQTSALYIDAPKFVIRNDSHMRGVKRGYMYHRIYSFQCGTKEPLVGNVAKQVCGREG